MGIVHHYYVVNTEGEMYVKNSVLTEFQFE